MEQMASFGKFAGCDVGPVLIDDLSRSWVDALENILTRFEEEWGRDDLVVTKYGNELGGATFEYLAPGCVDPVAKIHTVKDGDLWGLRSEWLWPSQAEV